MLKLEKLILENPTGLMYISNSDSESSRDEDIADLFNYSLDVYRKILLMKFNAVPLNYEENELYFKTMKSELYFKSYKDGEDAIEWIEGMIVMGKLVGDL